MCWSLSRLTGAIGEGVGERGDLPEPEAPAGGRVGLVGLGRVGGGRVGEVGEEEEDPSGEDIRLATTDGNEGNVKGKKGKQEKRGKGKVWVRWRRSRRETRGEIKEEITKEEGSESTVLRRIFPEGKGMVGRGGLSLGEWQKAKRDEKMEDRKADESDESHVNGLRPG